MSEEVPKEADQDSTKVKELLREMKEKNGKIIAHPYMYVSGLHNKSAYFPVDKNDPFFVRNEIEFLELPEERTGYETAPNPTYKYVVSLAGTHELFYKHTLVKEN